MEAWDRKALAFAALQRFWVIQEPASAESQWQDALAFAALPADKKTPGHWYKHEGQDGYIEYFPEGDQGAFHAELPAGIDPASIVAIPPLPGAPTIYDHMKGLLVGAAGANAQPVLDKLDELRSPTHANRVKSEIASGGFSALFAGKEGVSQYLGNRLQELSSSGLGQGTVTGFEVAALMLLDSLERQLLAATPPPPPNLKGKMFDPTGVPSLPEMTARFIHDCLKSGMGEAVNAAIDAIRKAGDGTLAAARNMTQGDLQPGLYLDQYYSAIQQAGIRFQAVRWAGLSVLTFGGLADKERAKYEQRVTSAEEKFVRMSSILLYAIKDLDGSRYREKQQAIREAMAAGTPEKADSVLYNVFVQQMFYPLAMRDAMSQGATGAGA